MIGREERTIRSRRDAGVKARQGDAAALPGGAQHLGDGGLQPIVGIRDHQLDAARASPGQAAQEVQPERFGLAVAER